MKIFAVSDSFAHFEEPIREFIIRLRGQVEIEFIIPTKHKDANFIVRTETEKIVSLLKKQKVRVIYLDIGAKMISTEDLEVEITRMKTTGVSIAFLVGGAYWVNTLVLEPYILRTVSLSPMTLPHSLALLVLLEQLYRVLSISRGSKYHHGNHA